MIVEHLGPWMVDTAAKELWTKLFRNSGYPFCYDEQPSLPTKSLLLHPANV